MGRLWIKTLTINKLRSHLLYEAVSDGSSDAGRKGTLPFVETPLLQK